MIMDGLLSGWRDKPVSVVYDLCVGFDVGISIVQSCLQIQRYAKVPKDTGYMGTRDREKPLPKPRVV